MKKLNQLATSDIQSLIETIDNPKTLVEDILLAGLRGELDLRNKPEESGAVIMVAKVLEEIDNLE